MSCVVHLCAINPLVYYSTYIYNHAMYGVVYHEATESYGALLVGKCYEHADDSSLL